MNRLATLIPPGTRALWTTVLLACLLDIIALVIMVGALLG